MNIIPVVLNALYMLLNSLSALSTSNGVATKILNAIKLTIPVSIINIPIVFSIVLVVFTSILML